jgi:hypothetical protein
VSASYAASAPGAFCAGAHGCLMTGMNVGGVSFDAAASGGDVPSLVIVKDASNGPVALRVAQDFNADLTWGGAGEPSVVVCGERADLSKSAVAFRPDSAVAVFVSTATSACPKVATSGSVTITYVTKT